MSSLIAKRHVRVMPSRPVARCRCADRAGVRELLRQLSVIELDAAGFKVHNGFGKRAERGPDIAPRVVTVLGEGELLKQCGRDRELLPELGAIRADISTTGEGDAADDDGHGDSSMSAGRPESVLTISVEVCGAGASDSCPCACGIERA